MLARLRDPLIEERSEALSEAAQPGWLLRHVRAKGQRIPAARLKAVPWTRFREEVSNAEAYRKTVDKPEMKPAGRGLNGPLDFLVFSSLI